MRSEKVDKAIKNHIIFRKNLKETIDEGYKGYKFDNIKEALEDIDTVLSYIEELEKRDKAVLVYFDKEGNPIEYINKQIIRDKIKKIDDEGIWITEDYYFNEELGEEYPICQKEFTKEELEDVIKDILKSIIGE